MRSENFCGAIIIASMSITFSPHLELSQSSIDGFIRAFPEMVELENAILRLLHTPWGEP